MLELLRPFGPCVPFAVPYAPGRLLCRPLAAVDDDDGLKEEDGSEESMHADELGIESLRNGDEEEAAVAEDEATAGAADDDNNDEDKESIELLLLLLLLL